MARVIDMLREDHRNIARLLDALDRQIAVFAAAGTPDYDVITGIAAYFLDYPDRCHHPKEDAVFARIAAAYPDEASAIGDLPREHRAVHLRAVRFSEAMHALAGDADLPRDFVAETARQFIDAERRHMQAEEARFLPLAERLLNEADWAEVDSAIAAQQDPIFGEATEAGFHAVRARLLAWETGAP